MSHTVNTTEPTSATTPGADPVGRVYMDAVLSPHRSLSRRGFVLMMAVVAVIAVIACVFYLHVGAWPVVGFFGLDVLLVWLAFRASYRQARVREHVRVTADRVDFARRSASGRVRRWSVAPQWARVELDDHPDGAGALRMSSRGESVSLGAFLSPGERSDFADALRAALDAARAERWPETEAAR